MHAARNVTGLGPRYSAVFNDCEYTEDGPTQSELLEG
jgi:hypothetical protein